MIRTADDGNGRFARRITLSILLLWLLSAQLSVQASWGQGKAAVPLYLDRTRPIEARVDDLLKRMTLKEKMGQLNLPCGYVDALGKTTAEKMDSARKFAAGTLTNEIGPGARVLHAGRYTSLEQSA